MNGDFQRVFSAIDEVPWQEVVHAYGPATDVPDLIRRLTSPDNEIRNDSWYQLHGNLWHQGTIYQATAYAVPVFLRLLEEPLTPAKYDILGYLALLFTGRSYWDVHQHLKMSEPILKKPDFSQKLERELHWVAATKEAVTKEKELYVGLLQKADAGTKIAAAYLLGVIRSVDVDTVEQVAGAAESCK